MTSRTEEQQRRQFLAKCFEGVDFNGDGVIDRRELEAVAKAFNVGPDADLDLQCRIILSKLDQNSDGVIDKEEWVSALYESFRFMTLAAFEKHCNELMAIVKASSAATRAFLASAPPLSPN